MNVIQAGLPSAGEIGETTHTVMANCFSRAGIHLIVASLPLAKNANSLPRLYALT